MPDIVTEECSVNCKWLNQLLPKWLYPTNLAWYQEQTQLQSHITIDLHQKPIPLFCSAKVWAVEWLILLLYLQSRFASQLQTVFQPTLSAMNFSYLKTCISDDATFCHNALLQWYYFSTSSHTTQHSKHSQDMVWTLIWRWFPAPIPASDAVLKGEGRNPCSWRSGSSPTSFLPPTHALAMLSFLNMGASVSCVTQVDLLDRLGPAGVSLGRTELLTACCQASRDCYALWMHRTTPVWLFPVRRCHGNSVVYRCQLLRVIKCWLKSYFWSFLTHCWPLKGKGLSTHTMV
jgi:hypothetical protein